MSDSTDTVETRVTISIEDYPLPVAEDARARVLEQFEEAVRGLLHWHADPGRIITRTGHHYVEVGDDCPRCGGTLALREYTYCDNGAVAEASCAHAPECDWRGRAVYRLVDLESEPVVDGESAVANGDLTPSYYLYESNPQELDHHD